MAMQIPVYQVNAFTDQLFSGNPATVCILPEWLDEKLLRLIAIENNQPATAFLVQKNGEFHVRWFSPEYEIDLCGHGSLASAYVIFNVLKIPSVEIDLHFQQGVLQLKKEQDLLTLNFPAKNLEAFGDADLLIQGLGVTPVELYQHKTERCLAIFEREEDIKNIIPDMSILKKLAHRGVVVSAPGKECDFVSRTFYPKKAACEDAVTGASHCLLIPYWANRLNKTKLTGYQCSSRGGKVVCENLQGRVLISGKARLYMEGVIEV